MTVQLDFPADIERDLTQRAARRGEPVEEFVRRLVMDTLADDRRLPMNDNRPEGAWSTQYPAERMLVDDSRESIYPELDSPVPSYLTNREELTARAREHLEVLALRQGVGAFVPQSPDRTDHWPPEETVEVFLSTIRQSREESPPRIRL